MTLASSLDFEVEDEGSLLAAVCWPPDFAPARPAALLLSLEALEAPTVVAVLSTLAVVGPDGAGAETTGAGPFAGGEGEGAGGVPAAGFCGADGVPASSREPPSRDSPGPREDRRLAPSATPAAAKPPLPCLSAAPERPRGAGCVNASPSWTLTLAGTAGSGPLRTAGQPSWEMKTTRPRPTAPIRARRASEALRSLSSMLSWARLKPPSELEKACPTLESTITTIGPSR